MTVHTWINGLNGAWYDAYVPQGSDLRTLDASLFGALNGDGGGNGVAWTPAAPIVLGGAGLWVAGPCLLGAVGNVQILTTALPITFGDSDYFQLVPGHSGATRVIHNPISRAIAAPTLWLPESSYYGLVSQVPGSTLDIPLKVHHGATLTNAQLNFAVGQAHAAVPAGLPGLRMVKIDAFGNVTPLVTSSSADTTGMVPCPTPPSASAWYASGAPQAFVCAMDAGVVIDTTQYSYHAFIQDEQGAGSLAGNIYTDLALYFTSIADTRPQ